VLCSAGSQLNGSHVCLCITACVVVVAGCQPDSSTVPSTIPEEPRFTDSKIRRVGGQHGLAMPSLHTFDSFSQHTLPTWLAAVCVAACQAGSVLGVHVPACVMHFECLCLAG
jgi:hypothetical protein